MKNSGIFFGNVVSEVPADLQLETSSWQLDIFVWSSGKWSGLRSLWEMKGFEVMRKCEHLWIDLLLFLEKDT